MGQTERLMDMWLYIVKHRAFTAGELARRFGVSPRTVTRDLEQLSVIGVPLYTVQGKGGGYRVLDSISLPPVSFSEDELNSILFAYHMLDLAGDNPFEVEIEAVREKLTRQMPDYIREKAASISDHADFMLPRRRVHPKHLRALYLASLSRTRVALEYDGREGRERAACFPIGTYAWEGFWYAVGFLPDAGRYRIFRVDRVASLEPLPGEPAPEGLWTLSEWKEKGFAVQEKCEIALELTDAALRRVTNPWMHDGTVEPLGGGMNRLTFECPESQVKFIVPEILRLGGGARVISPETVRARVRDALRSALNNYET